MLIRHAFPYLMPEPGAGGAGGADSMEVDLPGGVKVTLPKADALKVIAERDKRTADHRALAEKVGAEEAKRQAAEQKAADEARQTAEAKLAADGKLDELRRSMTADHDKRIAGLSSELTRLHLETMLATNANVVPEARGDAISLLLTSQTFKVDGGKLQVAGADGKPLLDQAGQAIGVDAFVASWLDKRPHYLRDKTPAGSGAANGAKPPAGAATITAVEYDRIARDPAKQPEAQRIAQDIAAKKLRVVTG